MRGTAHRTREQVSDPPLQDGMGGQPDHIAVVLRSQELIDLRRGKPCVSPEVAPLHHRPVSGDHRLQHLAPALGTMNIAWTQGTAFQVAELVEQALVQNSVLWALAERGLSV